MEDVELEGESLHYKINKRVEYKDVKFIGYEMKLGFKAKGVSIEEA